MTCVGAGRGQAIRHGLESYWKQLVVNDPQLPLMRHELFVYALRTPGQEHLARWQIEGYTRIVAQWCQRAASNAGEICAVPFDSLARAMVGGEMGTALDTSATKTQRDPTRPPHPHGHAVSPSPRRVPPPQRLAPNPASHTPRRPDRDDLPTQENRPSNALSCRRQPSSSEWRPLSLARQLEADSSASTLPQRMTDGQPVRAAHLVRYSPAHL